MSGPSCGDCRFFHQTGVLTSNGECHRYAPRPQQDWAWPYVNGGDWCGEWTPNGEAPRIELRPGTTLAQLFHDYVHVCAHGYIGATCGLCMAAWLPR